MRFHRLLLSIFLTSSMLPLPSAESEEVVNYSDAQIRAATCSLYTDQILGWAYYQINGALHWKKGINQTESIGGDAVIESKNTVRAIALGTEGDYIVFFTLRSFVDPLYPSHVIQGANKPIKNKQMKDVDFSSAKPTDYVRYSILKFMWLKDLGGGKMQYERGVDMATAFDAGTAKTYESSGSWGGYGSNVTEKYNDVSYERPHEDISVDTHYAIQEKGKQLGYIMYFDNHDVALLYLPIVRLTDIKATMPPTLGIKHPTLATDLCLRRSEMLFGFKFNLIGQETLDAIRAYRPIKDAVDFPGLNKLMNIIGLALDPTTLKIIRIVDNAIDEVIPENGKIKDVMVLWEQWKVLDVTNLSKITRLVRRSMFPEIP